MAVGMDPESTLTLLDWKRKVFDLYRRVRESIDSEMAWVDWCDVRNELFRLHPQSPLPEEERSGFSGLDYFDYDPELRVPGELAVAEPQTYSIATSGDSAYDFTRVANVELSLRGAKHSLELYWLEGYGGGLFLPFRDATAGETTYGAGRYLLDTVKGADLGIESGALVLDFNFSYNPSCAYAPHWVCPLATPANRLSVPIEAGERWSNEPG
jgi:uncharacterized protein